MVYKYLIKDYFSFSSLLESELIRSFERFVRCWVPDARVEAKESSLYLEIKKEMPAELERALLQRGEIVELKE